MLFQQQDRPAQKGIKYIVGIRYSQFRIVSNGRRKHQIIIRRFLWWKLLRPYILVKGDPHDRIALLGHYCNIFFSEHNPRNRVLREMVVNTPRHIFANAVIPALNLVQVFTSRQADMPSKRIDIVSGYTDYFGQSLPVCIILFLHIISG